MPAGFEGGAMPPRVGGAGAEALCAEFMAGKEGGGRWSSSSSELSCSPSVKVGMAGPFAAESGTAFGVVWGEREAEDLDLRCSSRMRGSSVDSLAGRCCSALPLCSVLRFAARGALPVAAV
jgi:hypothetical protein